MKKYRIFGIEDTDYHKSFDEKYGNDDIDVQDEDEEMEISVNSKYEGQDIFDDIQDTILQMAGWENEEFFTDGIIYGVEDERDEDLEGSVYHIYRVEIRKPDKK